MKDFYTDSILDQFSAGYLQRLEQRITPKPNYHEDIHIFRRSSITMTKPQKKMTTAELIYELGEIGKELREITAKLEASERARYAHIPEFLKAANQAKAPFDQAQGKPDQAQGKPDQAQGKPDQAQGKPNTFDDETNPKLTQPKEI
jgi:hypothetical protein